MVSCGFTRDDVLFILSPVGQEVVANSVCFVLLGVPLFDKLVDSNEVEKSHVELFDAVVRLVLGRQILHVLLSIGIVGRYNANNCEGGKVLHSNN